MSGTGGEGWAHGMLDGTLAGMVTTCRMPAGVLTTRRILAIGIATLVLPALAACEDTETGRAEQPTAVPVEATVAWEDTVRVTVPAVGSLEADQRVMVAAEVAGRVTDILFEEGQQVERGDVLLRLSADDLRAEVRAAEAALAGARQEAVNLEAQHRRNQDLVEQGAISEQAFENLATELESARARAGSAEAQLALAREELSDATVRAAFSGTVGEREVDIGAYVASGDPLFLLVDSDPLDIDFSVPEQYLGELQRGRDVSVRVSSHPGAEFAGSVTFIAPVVDPSTRTVQVKASVANPSGELKPGQFAEVVLDLDARPDAVLLPETAVVPSGGERYVYVAEGGEAIRRSVEIGARAPGRVEVLTGVSAGDTVVIAGQSRLTDRTPIAVTMVPGEPEPTESATAPQSAAESDDSPPAGDSGGVAADANRGGGATANTARAEG